MSAATASVFDVRDGQSILAVLVPALKTTYLYRITRTTVPPSAGPSSPDSKMVCTPIRQLDSVAIAPVRCTRPAQLDLVSLDSGGQLALLTADSHPIAMACSSTLHGKIVALERTGRDIIQVLLRIDSRQRQRSQLSLQHSVPLRLARDVLATLASVLPSKPFLAVYSRFLANSKRRSATDSIQALLEAILPAVVQPAPKAAELSDWEALLHAEQSSRASAGPTAMPEPPSSLPELGIVLFALRIMSEEWKLVSRRLADVILVAPLLANIAAHLGLRAYVNASARDGAVPGIEVAGECSRRRIRPTRSDIAVCAQLRHKDCGCLRRSTCIALCERALRGVTRFPLLRSWMSC